MFTPAAKPLPFFSCGPLDATYWWFFHGHNLPLLTRAPGSGFLRGNKNPLSQLQRGKKKRNQKKKRLSHFTLSASVQQKKPRPSLRFRERKKKTPRLELGLVARELHQKAPPELLQAEAVLPQDGKPRFSKAHKKPTGGMLTPEAKK